MQRTSPCPRPRSRRSTPRTGLANCPRVELVDAYLERIEAYDRSGPTLNSVVVTSDQARARAEELDSEEPTGALHGIPVLLKDNINTSDLPTAYGSVAMRGYRPREDATVARRMREAGAIVLGKTTLPDWATSWFSYSSLTTETRNPYDPNRDPGGSSSGTGAAIAANLATVGLGTDCGGSVRLPASFCNLVGVRSTPGVIPRTGTSYLVIPRTRSGRWPGPWTTPAASTASSPATTRPIPTASPRPSRGRRPNRAI